MFVNFKQKVSLISEPFSCKTQFSSDALPDMCGMAYDRKGKRLLVYNAAGSAYLYRMPEGERLSPRLKLKIKDGAGEYTTAFWKDWCWYIDQEFWLWRLDLRDGSICSVFCEAKRRILAMVQSGGNIYLFTDSALPGQESAPMEVSRYALGDGTISLEERKETPLFTCALDVKKDFGSSDYVLRVSRGEENGDEWAFFKEDTMELLPLSCKCISRLGPVVGFHTCLRANAVAFACLLGVQILDLQTKEVLEEATPKDKAANCCDVMFIDDYYAIVATWNGIGVLDSSRLLSRSVAASFADESDSDELDRGWLQAFSKLQELVRSEFPDLEDEERKEEYRKQNRLLGEITGDERELDKATFSCAAWNLYAAEGKALLKSKTRLRG